MARRRSWASEPRSEKLTPRFTKDELAAIRAAAAAAGLAPTAWLGQLAVAATRTPLPPAEEDALEDQRAAREQLARAGNLLNQAVAHAHRSGQPIPPGSRILDRVDRAVRRVDDTALALQDALAERQPEPKRELEPPA